MTPLARRLSIIVVSLLLLGGCATDATLKPWWTLREANFVQLQAGKMTKADVRTALGRPLSEVVFPRQQEEVWDYRYPDGTKVMLAWVYFDARGMYKYHVVQPDPAFMYAEGQS